MLRNACATAIADGALSCVVVDAGTGLVRAGIDHGGLDGSRALFEILAGAAPVERSDPELDSPLGREVLIVGAQHSSFACLTSSSKWRVVLVAPSTFSVALGWS